MSYITCKSCGKETEEKDFFGNKNDKCSWCGEEPHLTNQDLLGEIKKMGNGRFHFRNKKKTKKKLKRQELFNCVKCKHLIGTIEDFKEISNDIKISYSSQQVKFGESIPKEYYTKCPNCNCDCSFSIQLTGINPFDGSLPKHEMMKNLSRNKKTVFKSSSVIRYKKTI